MILEKQFWAKFRDWIKSAKSWTVITERIENKLNRGTPDVFFHIKSIDNRHVTGWIELKVSKSPAKIRHFTDAQRAWLYSKGHAGVSVFLAVYSGQTDYLWLFAGKEAARVVGNGQPWATAPGIMITEFKSAYADKLCEWMYNHAN